MKHIKTFENAFTDIFKKRKKLPHEVINFGDVLTKFIEKNIDMEWDVYSNTYESSNKKYYDVVRIFIDPHDIDDAAEVLELHYNYDRNSILYCYHPIMNFMEDIKDYLGNIVKNSSIEDVSSAGDNRYWIPLDKLPEIINKINSSDFDYYKSTKKFNI